MNKSISYPVIFALIIGLVAAVGCSDANATESLYLPMHEPCPFGDDAADEAQMDYDTEAEFDDQTLDAYEQYFDDVSETDLWFSSDVEPQTQAAPFMGPTPEATPASAPARDEKGSSERISRIDINSAGADELTDLPGIGPALAQRIIEYREARRFQNPSQLERVEGIGPATIRDIESLVRVE